MRERRSREPVDDTPLDELGMQAGWGGPDPEALAVATEHRELLQSAFAALAAEDREALRRAVHTIKPQLRMIGMTETADLAQVIETQAVEGMALDTLPGNVEQLLTAIRHSLAVFQPFLK